MAQEGVWTIQKAQVRQSMRNNCGGLTLQRYVYKKRSTEDAEPPDSLHLTTSAIELVQIFAKVGFILSGDKTRYVGTARCATVQPIALCSGPCRFQWLFPEKQAWSEIN